MEYLITFVVVGVILAVFTVKHLIKKSFSDGFNFGYDVAIEFDRRMAENAKRYAEIIRKEADE